MSDQTARGVGQKLGEFASPAPPSLSRADFFCAERDFDLFGNPVHPASGSRKSVKRPASKKTLRLADAVRALAQKGLTRKQIAIATGVGESTLYANYFLEIGGRPGRPGRRLHAPTDGQRRMVALRAAQGAACRTIAAELGLSLPTLRKHYAVELSGSASFSSVGD